MKNLENINIRTALPADLGSLAGLLRLISLQPFKKDYDSKRTDPWAFIVPDYNSILKRIVEQYFLVAESNYNTINAFGSLSKSGFLDLRYVLNDSPSLEIASVLLDKLVEKAVDYGCTEITTDAGFTARPFFESHDFKVIKDQTFVLHNRVYENFKMLKQLV